MPYQRRRLSLLSRDGRIAALDLESLAEDYVGEARRCELPARRPLEEAAARLREAAALCRGAAQIPSTLGALLDGVEA